MNIESYKTGDENAILDLFQLAFGKKLSLDYWNWRFVDNPFSKTKFIDLMWDEGKLIGHYAISPVEMIIDGKVEKTALSMTTMTHPEYGGRGVFSQLAESLYNKLSNDDYKIVWGFPNNNSHYGFNKNLHWNDIAIQAMMSLEVKDKTIPFVASECQYITNPTDIGDDIVSMLNSSDKYLRINKTKAYIKWRYFDNPAAEYKFVFSRDKKGILIYKLIPSFTNRAQFEVDIMDIFFNNDLSTLTGLLTFIFNTEKDISKFNLWCSLYSDEKNFLEKSGFKITPPITYLGYRPLNINDSSIADYRNWDISFSYSDVF